MDTADFYIANQLDLLDSMQGVTETFTILLASIAAISLLVGGIGIMNIMLVSVTERTREIGVRMALGATASDILRQFITEAVIISLFGGLVGIGLGIGSSWAASNLGGMAAQVSLDSVLMAFGFAFAIGLFFGGYPAYRASRLDPIEALRYE
jgi:putative ABC transport system permease protein